MIAKRVREYDKKVEVLRFMHYEALPKDLMEKHQGYPEYWQKRWVCIRVFNKLQDADRFIKEIL